MGKGSSGKTTLLRLLNRLLVPDEGEITFQERALSDWDPVQLRRRVVMLGQTPVLYHETVEENLQIGRRFADKPPASRSQMEQMLERMELPKQLDQWCDKFSGGEKQRLCLARILLMDADVYLLDEPSAALDSDTEERILDYLLHFVQETKKQPTLNNMLTMGIVSLPGMMTGPILSGTFPLTAIKYQIGIMLAILGCTSLTVLLFVTLGYQTFFTPYASLREEQHPDNE